MSSQPLVTPAAARASATLGALLAGVAAIAVVGVVLTARLLTAGSGDAATAPGADGPFRVGDDVPTSFGWVAVEHAETTKGLTAKQLGGATHGIGTFVGRDKALVQASVTLTNSSTEPVRYDPRQFQLVATPSKGADKGKERRIGVSYASIKAGVLQPDAAIDARVSFVAPRDDARLALAFTDPGRKAPLVIDLKQRSGRVTANEKQALRTQHGAGHAGH